MSSLKHQPILTEDGSPSLLTTYASGVVERMHHFRGALTESLYIYLPAIEWSFANCTTPVVMSLGLGLGYNELLTVAAWLKSSSSNPLRLVTFENDVELKEHFTSWLLERNSTELDSTYQVVLTQTAAAMKIDPAALKLKTRVLFTDGSWEIRGAFPETLRSEDRFHAILYDAFSAKMDEPLWSEDQLTGFLNAHAAPHCALATYAAKGSLKRALKANGFTLQPKGGFGGKKESTFATRP